MGMKAKVAVPKDKQTVSLRRTLNVDGRDSGHETTLENTIRLRGLVVTVQLALLEVFPEALRTCRGTAVTGPGQLWTGG